MNSQHDSLCISLIALTRSFSAETHLKEKTLRYRFHIVHIPGVKHWAADTLSHHPTRPTDPEKLPLPDDIASVKDALDLPSLTDIRCSFLAGIRMVDESNTNDDQMNLLMTTNESACLNSDMS